MALSVVDKNLLISAMERGLIDAKENAGVSELSEVETAVSALRTAFDDDPATVTAAAIVSANAKVSGLVVPSLENIRSVLTEAQQEAGA